MDLLNFSVYSMKIRDEVKNKKSFAMQLSRNLNSRRLLLIHVDLMHRNDRIQKVVWEWGNTGHVRKDEFLQMPMFKAATKHNYSNRGFCF